MERCIYLWKSYIKRGAPSNACGSRQGYGRTKDEASENAGHWANQAPWEGFKRVMVSNHPSHNATVIEIVGWIDFEFLPPTRVGEMVLELVRKGRFVEAIEAYYAAIDGKQSLVR